MTNNANITWTESEANGFHYWTSAVSHGMTDEKGREVGGEVVVTLNPADHYAPSTAGKFIVRCWAMRNGTRYGAIPRSTVYDTLEAAQQHAAKAIATQAKSYAKKYGKVA